MFNDQIINALSSLAVALENPDVVAGVLTDCCDYQNLSSHEKGELGAIISKILIGFLCSEENLQQSVFVTGTTDGAFDEKLILNIINGAAKSSNEVSTNQDVQLIG